MAKRDGSSSHSADTDEQRRRPVTYLHVGAPKSGTTFIQSVMWNNRDALRDNGVLYAGDHYLSHTHAALDLQRQTFYGFQDPAVPGAWQRMVEEIRAWDGTAIISQELLSPAGPDAIERAMSSLTFSDVHLVYTARDLARQVPAVWQENVKNRYAMGFEEFLSCLRAPAEEMHPLGAGFWSMQDAAGVLSNWARDLAPQHVHLITIPPGDAPRTTLWARFCHVTGLDADRYSLSGAAANVSLGVSEANLMLRLNLALGDDLRWPLYNMCVTGLIGIDVLAARPGRRTMTLPGPERAWIAERSQQMIEALRKEDYDVVGDLEELMPAVLPQSAVTTRPPEPADAEMLDAAVQSIVALLGRLQRWSDELDLLTAERDGLQADLGALRADLDMLIADLASARTDRDHLEEEVERLREVLAKPAMKLFVRRLSEQYRAVMLARIVYWNLVEAGRRLRRWVASWKDRKAAGAGGRPGGDD